MEEIELFLHGCNTSTSNNDFLLPESNLKQEQPSENSGTVDKGDRQNNDRRREMDSRQLCHSYADNSDKRGRPKMSGKIISNEQKNSSGPRKIGIKHKTENPSEGGETTRQKLEREIDIRRQKLRDLDTGATRSFQIRARDNPQKSTSEILTEKIKLNVVTEKMVSVEIKIINNPNLRILEHICIVIRISSVKILRTKIK